MASSGRICFAPVLNVISTQWYKFWRTSKRHEIIAMREQGFGPIEYDSRRTEAARKLATDGITNAILSGGVRSPACFAGRGDVVLPWQCPQCEALGTHQRVFWECQLVEERLGTRPEPVDEWQRRYGWPALRSYQQDMDVMAWMRKVTNLIWDARHENDKKEAQKLEATNTRRLNRFIRTQDDRRRQDEVVAAEFLKGKWYRN